MEHPVTDHERVWFIWTRWIKNINVSIIVVQSCPTLCDPMDCSTPGFPVLHHLLELAQTHVHWVSDAIQPSYPLSPLLLLLTVFSSIRVFSNELTLCIRRPKYIGVSASVSVLLMNIQDWLVGSPCSPRDSQESSPTPQFKSINCSAFSLLYGPTLTSIHDFWKNYSFDYTDLCWQSNVFSYPV